MVAFPKRAVASLSVPFVPLVGLARARAHGYTRHSFDYVPHRHIESYGYYLLWCALLLRVRPRCVVIPNDHLGWHRSLLAATQTLGVESVYLQHASTNESFPRLAFSYAFLEGEDALRKYARAGSSPTEVFLVGMPKADGWPIASPGVREAMTVGLCLNVYDTIEHVRTVGSALSASGIAAVVRTHPGASVGLRKQMEAIAQTAGLAFSDGAIEPVASYLRKVTVLVAGDSSIHLEAVLANVYPIYFSTAQEPRDIYGYLRDGLVETVVRSVEELLVHLHKLRYIRPDVRSRAKAYVDTIGTAFDGRSSSIVAELLDEIVVRGGPDTGRWTAVATEPRIRGYRLSS